MDQQQVRQWIMKLIAEGRLHDFYVSGEWEALRDEVLREDKHECQQCKQAGYYEPANTVHHVKPVKRFPELALSKVYFEDGKEYRQLISLSNKCHEHVHPNRRQQEVKPLTEERW